MTSIKLVITYSSTKRRHLYEELYYLDEPTCNAVLYSHYPSDS